MLIKSLALGFAPRLTSANSNILALFFAVKELLPIAARSRVAILLSPGQNRMECGYVWENQSFNHLSTFISISLASATVSNGD